MHGLRALPEGAPFVTSMGTLAWRPDEGAAAEQVDVEMIDSLSAVRAGVDHQAIARGQTLLAGDLGDGPQQVTEQLAIRRVGVVQRGNVFARRHQHMDGRLGVKVGEGVAQLVLVDRLRGNASINDLTKDATHDGTSLQEQERFVNKNEGLQHSCQQDSTSMVKQDFSALRTAATDEDRDAGVHWWGCLRLLSAPVSRGGRLVMEALHALAEQGEDHASKPTCPSSGTAHQ